MVFVEDRSICGSCRVTHIPDDRPRTFTAAPGLVPAGNPCRPHVGAADTALGLASSRIFGHRIGALKRARPRMGHQPPATASGAYPLMGFTAVPASSSGEAIAASALPVGHLSSDSTATLQRLEGLMP